MPHHGPLLLRAHTLHVGHLLSTPITLTGHVNWNALVSPSRFLPYVQLLSPLLVSTYSLSTFSDISLLFIFSGLHHFCVRNHYLTSPLFNQTFWPGEYQTRIQTSVFLGKEHESSLDGVMCDVNHRDGVDQLHHQGCQPWQGLLLWGYGQGEDPLHEFAQNPFFRMAKLAWSTNFSFTNL